MCGCLSGLAVGDQQDLFSQLVQDENLGHLRCESHDVWHRSQLHELQVHLFTDHLIQFHSTSALIIWA